MHENWVQPSSCPSGLWWKLHRAPAYKDDCGSVEPIRSISTGILISCYSLLQFTISKTFWWFHSNYKNTTTCQRSCVWHTNKIKQISLKKERFVMGKIWHLFSILKYLYLEHLAQFVNVIMHLGTFHVICNVKSQ